MSIEIKVPVLPESIADALVAKWHKKPGEAVKCDETIVDIETDKVVLEVPAPEDGVLEEIICEEGTTVLAEQLIGKIKPGAVAATLEETVVEVNGSVVKKDNASIPSQASDSSVSSSSASVALDVSPAVRRIIAEHNLDISAIKGSGKGGRIVKEDVENHLKNRGSASSASTSTVVQMPGISQPMGERSEQRVKMSRLRQRVAERLLGAQHQMAILTTYNEVNMKAIKDLRQTYKASFEKTHNIRLGFMSFFVKAVAAALQRFPDVNAYIDGDEIIYHSYADIGVAVSTDRGLVVPILRNAEQMTMAGVESQIAEYAQKARNNKITLEDMTGGTFSITNGGVFGSLLSAPILNPPQSAILGMHKIEDRPVVVNGEIVIRPMMYLALSYDHRIIDGKQSVSFLRTVKELLEDPTRLLLEV